MTGQALARIEISRRCEGIYARWYYNGWHYWLFVEGDVTYMTEGENYRTLGKQKIVVGSTQLTQQQVNAVRSIENCREVQVYTDYGWRNAMVLHDEVEVRNNITRGYDVEVTMILGSRSISKTGNSPVILIPDSEPDYKYCETLPIGMQVWMCLNYDVAYPGSLVYNGDESLRATNGGLYTHEQVMASGFCPPGWRVPTLADWEELFNNVGSLLDAGKLKDTSYWLAPNTGANNEENFRMRSTGTYSIYLPACPTPCFHGIGETALLWATDGFVRFNHDSAEVQVNPFTLSEVHELYFGVRLIRIDNVVAVAAEVDSHTAFVAKWNACAGATEYYLDVSKSPTFATFVVNNLNVGNVLSHEVTGLDPGETYYYRLRAGAGTGCESAGNSNVITVNMPEAFVISSRGDGSGVGVLSVTTSDDVLLTLTGSARFYSNNAGTLDESTTWLCTSGVEKKRYIKCTSGTALMMFSKLSAVKHLGESVVAWNVSIIGNPTVAVPTINWRPFIKFPNLITIATSDTTLNTLDCDLAELPSSIKVFSINASGTITGNLNTLPAGITSLRIISYNTISGNINTLPAGIITFEVRGGNTVTGNVTNIPASCIVFSCHGNNTLTGDVKDITTTVTTLDIAGANTVSGDIGDAPPSIISFGLAGNNTLTGVLNDLPATCTSLFLTGNNDITGDFTSLNSNMVRLTIEGVNTVSGDLADIPVKCVRFEVLGNNIVTGDLSSITSLKLTIFSCTGNNVITGSLSSLPTTLNLFNVAGKNTIYGDVGDVASTLNSFTLAGLNVVSDYSGKSWHPTSIIFSLTTVSPGGLSTAEVDQLLIDIDNDCSFTGSAKTIKILGSNAAPTATSAAARASLVAKGVLLLTN